MAIKLSRSATGHPIHFMFGSRVGFLGSADRMALFSVGRNTTGMDIGDNNASHWGMNLGGGGAPAPQKSILDLKYE